MADATTRRRTQAEARVCSQEGCPGDGRYMPPGKAHLPGCQHNAVRWVWEDIIPPRDDVPEGEPFAWTPDDVMERGVEEFKRLWPDKWEAWLRWCESESANETHVIPPGDDDG